MAQHGNQIPVRQCPFCLFTWKYDGECKACKRNISTMLAETLPWKFDDKRIVAYLCSEAEMGIRISRNQASHWRETGNVRIDKIMSLMDECGNMADVVRRVDHLHGSGINAKAVLPQEAMSILAEFPRLAEWIDKNAPERSRAIAQSKYVMTEFDRCMFAIDIATAMPDHSFGPTPIWKTNHLTNLNECLDEIWATNSQGFLGIKNRESQWKYFLDLMDTMAEKAQHLLGIDAYNGREWDDQCGVERCLAATEAPKKVRSSRKSLMSDARPLFVTMIEIIAGRSHPGSQEFVQEFKREAIRGRWITKS